MNVCTDCNNSIAHLRNLLAPQQAEKQQQQHMQQQQQQQQHMQQQHMQQQQQQRVKQSACSLQHIEILKYRFGQGQKW